MMGSSSPGGRRGGERKYDAELFRAFVESVEDYAIFFLDVDGNVQTWNAGARRLKGYEPHEIIGRHFSAFYPDEDREAGKPDRELAIAAAEGRIEDEGWRLRKDGSRFWANVLISALRGPDGRLEGFGKITRDLTDRKRGEDSVRDSEERFHLLVDSVADYAIFMLDPDGRVASWNRGAERLKQYRPEDIIGRHFSSFYPEEDVRAGKPARLLARAEEDGRVEDEGWRVRKDGSLFWANVVITALRGPGGDLRGFAKVTRDLTDRKRGEDALRGILERERDTAEKLRRLDRAKDEFVAMVAHDLRSPMSVVAGYASTLLDDWAALPDEEKRHFVERIDHTTSHLAALIDDILQVARIDAGEMRYARQPFDIAALVERAARDVSAADGGTRVEIQTARNAPMAHGDAQRTWQVVTNLLSNALKFSEADASVRVGIGGEDGMVLVSIVDNGPGIAPEDHDKIFDRFARLPIPADAEKGTGLGLFIAKSMVEAQGGEIWVESALGEGATFRFTVPAAPAS